MSFAVFVVYVALTFLRPFEFVPELEQFRPMLLVWALGFLLALRQMAGGGGQAARAPHYGLLLVLVAVIFLSSLARVGPGYALEAVNAFSPSAMLLVLSLLNLTTVRRLRITCITVSLCMVTLAAAGIVSFHTGWNASLLVLRQSGDDEAEVLDTEPEAVVPAQDTSGRWLWRVRSVGLLNDPNDFAQALVFSLPLLVLTLGAGGRFMRGVRFAVPGSVMGYAIALTHSRGAIVGIGAMLLLALRRVLGGARALLLTGMLAAGGLLTGFGGGRAFSAQEQSAGERIEAWWVGLELLRTYPLLGAGFNRFLEHNKLTAHNSYVLCFAELGLLGLFAWLGLVVLTIKGLNAAQAAAAPHAALGREAQLAALLKAALVGTLACCWFLSRTFTPTLYLMLALGIGAWFCTGRALQAVQAAPLDLPPWRAATVGACFACVAAAWGFVMLQGAGR